MDDYYVGSIADLITHGKVNKTKLNKKKSVSKSEETNVQLDLNECQTEVTQLKSKNKLDKSKNKELDEHNADLELLPKNKKCVKTKLEVKSKKRKKATAETANDSEALELSPKPKKKRKTLVDLPVPSDSEEEREESENMRETQKKKNSDKKLQYKDFTDHTVFVGNIPINYDKQKICKVFGKFGKILSARIRCVPVAEINMSKKVAAVRKQFNPKRNSLVAYVKYETQDSAKDALKANGMVIDGHHIRVDLAEEEKERDTNKAVFVGGLPFDLEDDELWNFFQDCGKITSVRIIRDSLTSMGKGFGYVNFDSSASVELALQLDGQELKKRKINVKRCKKARNKNKMNAFGKMKSREMTDQLRGKKGKKFKTEKKKSKGEKKILPSSFQGNKANIKQKKKKKLSKAALHKRKIVKILGAS